MNEIFNSLKFIDGYGYECEISINIFGQDSLVQLHICTDSEVIASSQKSSFREFVSNLDEIGDRISEAILNYYNTSEKYAYGPDDELMMKQWWPDIDTADEMKKHLICEFITVFYTTTENPNEKIEIGVAFSRDWGGEDAEDNGVAAIIQNGTVKEVGYNDIAI